MWITIIANIFEEKYKKEKPSKKRRIFVLKAEEMTALVRL
jgi:hypothetical protein